MKTHLRSNHLNPDNYKNSPHVQHAIASGLVAKCGLLTHSEVHITDDISRVACKMCVIIDESKHIRGTQ
jgi:hypothetical protein